MKTRSRPLYYGWVVTAATGGIGFANAASAISILTIFVVPLSEEFGWGRAEIAGATTVGAILGASLAPFVGRLVDRFGSRVILVISGTVIGLACLYLSVMHTLVGFYLAFTASRIADQGGVKIGTSVTTGKWFQRYRGRATGLVFFAETAGIIALAPLIHLVISQWGWRPAWVTLAALMFVLGVLPCALWVRRQPEDMGLTIDGDRRPATGSDEDPSMSPGMVRHERSLTLRDAAGTWGYWLALGSLFIGSNATSGVGLHLVPYLTEQGIGTAARGDRRQCYGNFRGRWRSVSRRSGRSSFAPVGDGSSQPDWRSSVGAAGERRHSSRYLCIRGAPGAGEHRNQHTGADNVGKKLRAPVSRCYPGRWPVSPGTGVCHWSTGVGNSLRCHWQLQSGLCGYGCPGVTGRSANGSIENEVWNSPFHSVGPT